MVVLPIDIAARRSSVLVDIGVCEKIFAARTAKNALPPLQPFQLCRCVLSSAQLNTLERVSAVRSQRPVQAEKSVFAGRRSCNERKRKKVGGGEDTGRDELNLRGGGAFPGFLRRAVRGRANLK